MAVTTLSAVLIGIGIILLWIVQLVALTNVVGYLVDMSLRTDTETVPDDPAAQVLADQTDVEKKRTIQGLAILVDISLSIITLGYYLQ